MRVVPKVDHWCRVVCGGIWFGGDRVDVTKIPEWKRTPVRLSSFLFIDANELRQPALVAVIEPRKKKRKTAALSGVVNSRTSVPAA